MIATIFLLELDAERRSIGLFSLEMRVNTTELIFGHNDLYGGIALREEKEIAYKRRHSIHSCFSIMFYIDQMSFILSFKCNC